MPENTLQISSYFRLERPIYRLAFIGLNQPGSVNIIPSRTESRQKG